MRAKGSREPTTASVADAAGAGGAGGVDAVDAVDGGAGFAVAFDAMASRCEIRLDGLDADRAQALAALAIDEVRRIERKFSRYRDDSVVGRINRAAGAAPVACDAETGHLLDYADALYRASDGRFDITAGVLRRAWDFRRPAPPAQAAIDAVLGLIGWPRVERDGDAVRLPLPGMELDFGGFGKEYAADRAATLLLDAIVAAGAAPAGLVNLGGDLRVIGPRADGRPWRIAIQHPRDPRSAVAAIDVARGALATSGDYERFLVHEGRRYCHVLDPRTGWPVGHWQSVSVLAPLAIAAGSCATIAMLLEADGLPFLQDGGFEFLAVGPDGGLHRSGPRPSP